MIIDPYKEKRVSFVLNLEGTSHDKLDISMFIDIDAYELKVPMTIEHGKVVGTIPKLSELRENLPEEVDVKVIVVAEGESFTVFEKKMKVENEKQQNIRIEEMRREEAFKIESEYANRQKEVKKIAEDMITEREKVRDDIDRLTAQKQVMEEVEIGWILKEEIARKKAIEYSDKKVFAERIAKGIKEKKVEKVEPKIEEKTEEKKVEPKIEEKTEEKTEEKKVEPKIEEKTEEKKVEPKIEEKVKPEKRKSKFVSKLTESYHGDKKKDKKKKVKKEEEEKVSKFARRLTE